MSDPRIAITDADMANAHYELSTKSMAEIETRTAMAWAARALQAYARYIDTGKTKWYLHAETYAGEALEHSAVGLDGTFEYVKEQIREMRATVKAKLDGLRG